MKDNLRYRYFAWLEQKLDSMMEEIDDTPKSLRNSFNPQDEYSFGEQFFISFMVPFFGFWVVCLRAKRLFDKLELGEKLTVKKPSLDNNEMTKK